MFTICDQLMVALMQMEDNIRYVLVEEIQKTNKSDIITSYKGLIS